jgi:hypothetical protein
MGNLQIWEGEDNENEISRLQDVHIADDLAKCVIVISK